MSVTIMAANKKRLSGYSVVREFIRSKLSDFTASNTICFFNREIANHWDSLQIIMSDAPMGR